MTMVDDGYDPELAAHLDAAIVRSEGTFRRYAPHLAAPVFDRLRSMAPDGQLAGYFRHEYRFPMLLLPWWLSRQLGMDTDAEFQADVAYSTIAGYCHIRILDDLVDGGPLIPELAAGSTIFQAEFQRVYARWFPSRHAFWDSFRAQWYGAADFAIDHPAAHDFEQRVSRRLGPVLIPLTAVAGRAELPSDRLTPWREVTSAVGRAEQVLDDLFDWPEDARRAGPNCVLAARTDLSEPIESWMIREGVAGGLDRADGLLDALAAVASPIGSAGLDGFIERRKGLVRRLRADLTPGLRQLDRVREAFRPPA